jgi:hypothetical protein
VVDQDELRQELNNLYAERKEADPGYSWARFGTDLAQMLGRPEAYTKGYIYAVSRGKKGYPVSPELADGLARLNAIKDGVSEFQARLQPVPSNALSVHPIHAGAIIMGTSRLCATPGCGVWFASDNSRRRFCPKCRPGRAGPSVYCVFRT